MKACQKSVFSGKLTKDNITQTAVMVPITLQACGLRQKTLLVISNQVNTEAGDELLIRSLEVRQATSLLRTEATSTDLAADISCWLSMHQITESVETVFQQCLVGCDSLVEVKSRLNVHQRDSQLPTDIWNRDRLLKVLREVMQHSE